jgi:hypothetical protein
MYEVIDVGPLQVDETHERMYPVQMTVYNFILIFLFYIC